MTTILVIEDEAPIRDEVIDWLRFEGFRVIYAGNGRIGLELARQNKPDLILCDIAMPEMNGHEVLVEIRSNPDLTHLPFIFLTADADRHAIRKGMNLGADDYLTKPFTHAELLNAIHARLQKRAFQEIQQQEQIAMLNEAFQEEQKKRLLKSRLMAMFSHDFRNPLTLILMASSILSEGDDQLSPERKAHQHDRIRGSVHLLLQMLDDMLLVAEMESGYLEYTPKAIHLGNFSEKIVQEFRLIDQGSHQISCHIGLVGEVEADRKLFRQILANLLSNAIKYSPADSEITVYLREENGRIYLEVADQGIGIPAESVPHLFEPFHRANNAKQVKGTGLGLTIVKECADHHRGEIELQTELGKGSRFIVQFPLERVALNGQSF